MSKHGDSHDWGGDLDPNEYFGNWPQSQSQASRDATATYKHHISTKANVKMLVLPPRIKVVVVPVFLILSAVVGGVVFFIK